jgi:hypothetical protein
MAVALGTFMSWMGLSPDLQLPLFAVYFGFNILCFFIYSILQIILVTKTLEDRWPLGDIFFGMFFFLAGVAVILFANNPICSLVLHYTDGMFFGTIAILFAVMMVYKYWDSITKEDLEFSIGGIPHSWEVGNKGKLLPESDAVFLDGK